MSGGRSPIPDAVEKAVVKAHRFEQREASFDFRVENKETGRVRYASVTFKSNKKKAVVRYNGLAIEWTRERVDYRPSWTEARKLLVSEMAAKR